MSLVVDDVDRAQRRELVRRAQEIRLRALREGLAPDAIVTELTRALPALFPLEAWRLAHGWTRAETVARIHALYEADGLAPPTGISAAELCRWEHQQRRPNAERIEYLCRLFGTRPDRLGFGVDFGRTNPGHLQEAGISNLWPRTGDDSYADLVARVRAARTAINVFGLTRNFYARDEILPLFEAKAVEIPVTFFVMAPGCASRRDRYRLEPAEAAMEDPRRYAREILVPLRDAARHVAPSAAAGAGLRIYTYDFPCSFAMEQVDDHVRVMLYGHGQRGTDGPILVFDEGTPYYEYFDSQIRWLFRLAEEPREPWISKGLHVRPLDDTDLFLAQSGPGTG